MLFAALRLFFLARLWGSLARYRPPRQIAKLCCWVALLLAGCSAGLAKAAEPEESGTGKPTATREVSCDLRPAQRADQLQLVKVVLEVAGQLKLNADGKQVTKLPLQVAGNLLYEEKLVTAASGAGPQRSVRYYREAGAEITAGQRTRKPELSQDRRLVAVQAEAAKATLFSPLGPLTRDELELLEVPANTLLLHGLLPNRMVQVGDSWTIDKDILAGLLDLDAVSTAEVKSRLASVDQRIAVVEVEGVVSGAVGGVATEVELKAKYNFDQSLGRITWLAMALKENRSIGHAEPGFEVTAKLRMVLSPLEQSEQLREEVLADLPLAADPGLTLLNYQASQGGFRLLHDRRWQVMVDRRELSVLRMVDRGDLVAQCNVSRLPDLPQGQQIQLEEFQQDIQRTLGESFRQFLEATQSDQDGLRTLRVVAQGIASEIPVQWFYYHLADGQGRRVGLVFTLEQDFVERFGGLDQSLISSLELIGSSEASTAAAPSSAAGSRQQ